MIDCVNGSTIQPIYSVNNTRSERSKWHTFFCKNCSKTHHMLYTDSMCVKGDWYCMESVKRLIGN